MLHQDDESLRRWKEQLLGAVDFESVGGIRFHFIISALQFYWNCISESLFMSAALFDLNLSLLMIANDQSG